MNTFLTWIGVATLMAAPLTAQASSAPAASPSDADLARELMTLSELFASRGEHGTARDLASRAQILMSTRDSSLAAVVEYQPAEQLNLTAPARFEVAEGEYIAMADLNGIYYQDAAAPGAFSIGGHWAQPAQAPGGDGEVMAALREIRGELAAMRAELAALRAEFSGSHARHSAGPLPPDHHGEVAGFYFSPSDPLDATEEVMIVEGVPLPPDAPDAPHARRIRIHSTDPRAGAGHGGAGHGGAGPSAPELRPPMPYERRRGVFVGPDGEAFEVETQDGVWMTGPESAQRYRFEAERAAQGAHARFDEMAALRAQLEQAHAMIAELHRRLEGGQLPRPVPGGGPR